MAASRTAGATRPTDDRGCHATNLNTLIDDQRNIILALGHASDQAGRAGLYSIANYVLFLPPSDRDSNYHFVLRNSERRNPRCQFQATKFAKDAVLASFFPARQSQPAGTAGHAAIKNAWRTRIPALSAIRFLAPELTCLTLVRIKPADVTESLFVWSVHQPVAGDQAWTTSQ